MFRTLFLCVCLCFLAIDCVKKPTYRHFLNTIPYAYWKQFVYLSSAEPCVHGSVAKTMIYFSEFRSRTIRSLRFNSFAGNFGCPIHKQISNKVGFFRQVHGLVFSKIEAGEVSCSKERRYCKNAPCNSPGGGVILVLWCKQLYTF